MALICAKCARGSGCDGCGPSCDGKVCNCNAKDCVATGKYYFLLLYSKG